MAIPYASRRSYTPDSSIIQLIQQAGHDAAQGQRQGGAIWGNAVRDIGGIAAGTIQDIAAGKAHAAEVARKEAIQAPILADEAKLRALNIQRSEREVAEADKEAARTAWFESKLQSGEMPKPAEVMAMMGEKRGFDVIKGIGLLQPDGAARYGDQAKVLRDAARAVKALPAAAQPAAWGVMRSSLISQQAVDASMVPEAFDANLLEQAASYGQEPTKPPNLELKETGAGFQPWNPQAGTLGAPVAPPKPNAPKEPVYKDIGGQTYEIKNGVAVPVKIQGGVQAPTPDEAPFINQPGYAKLSNAAKTAVTSMNNFIQAAEKYRSKLDTLTGPTGILLTGEDAADLDSEHAALLFTAAKAFEQGALQAPDKAVVEQMIPNPAKWSSMLKTATQGGKAGQMRAMNTTIKNFKDRMKSTWGLSATPVLDTQPLENGTRVTVPSSTTKPKLVQGSDGVWERR